MSLVSKGTVITLVVGLLVAGFYLRYMWAALQQAVVNRDRSDVGQDRYGFSFAGAIVAVVASSAAIAGYGWAPALLYLGPLLALASAVAVAYCLRREVTEPDR
jgi:hypothetical protein